LPTGELRLVEGDPGEDDTWDAFEIKRFSAYFNAVDGAFTKTSRTWAGICRIVRARVMPDGVAEDGIVVLSDVIAHGVSGQRRSISRWRIFKDFHHGQT